MAPKAVQLLVITLEAVLVIPWSSIQPIIPFICLPESGMVRQELKRVNL
jgi:hypothetical protein